MSIRDLNIEKKRLFVGLLEIACEKLEITKTEFATAKERYESVGHWLSSSEQDALANASIYAQGSIRIQTTVRPIGRNEFDVDLICHLPRANGMTPAIVRDMVGQRLADHGTYRSMLIPLNRGWRLNYANEFHMDITPAIEDVNHHSGIVVPDRALKCWKESHPIGYAEWFQEIARREPIALTEDMKAQPRADIEPLPEQQRFKGSLRRIIQIMKRHRDIYFSKKNEAERGSAPISIVITTLAAKAYHSCISTTKYTNELDLLVDVVHNMPSHIEKKIETNPPILAWQVANPVNAKENFAEKWKEHPERASAFYEWNAKLKLDLDVLAGMQGLDSIGRGLQEMLGESISEHVLKEYAVRLTSKRQAGQLISRASGAIAAVTPTSFAYATVQKNTFYGND